MKRFLDAFRFMTIIPLPGSKHGDLQDVGRATAFFPLVGLLVGAVPALSVSLTGLIWSAPVTAVTAVILWVILTAGLHVDGLADLADGLGGGWDIESRLRIMKDSAIGTYGALAVGSLLILKAVFIFELLAHPENSGILLPCAALILIPAAARCAQVLSIRIFPSAKKEGFGIIFKNSVRNIDWAAALITAAAALSAVWGLAGLVILGSAIVFMLALGSWINSRLGGLNGDSYGAVCELTELFLLILISLLRPEFSGWLKLLVGGAPGV